MATTTANKPPKTAGSSANGNGTSVGSASGAVRTPKRAGWSVNYDFIDVLLEAKPILTRQEGLASIGITAGCEKAQICQDLGLTPAALEKLLENAEVKLDVKEVWQIPAAVLAHVRTFGPFTL